MFVFHGSGTCTPCIVLTICGTYTPSAIDASVQSSNVAEVEQRVRRVYQAVATHRSDLDVTVLPNLQQIDHVDDACQVILPPQPLPWLSRKVQPPAGTRRTHQHDANGLS